MISPKFRPLSFCTRFFGRCDRWGRAIVPVGRLVLATTLMASAVEAGEIQGIVTRENGGPGIASADVLITPVRWTVRTDRDGRFSVKNLPVGKYRLTVSQTGLRPETVMVQVEDESPISGLNIPVFDLEPSDQSVPRIKHWRWMTVEEWWDKHDANLRRARKGKIDVVFLGDSITEQWSTVGREVWEDWFNPDHVANFGIGGDTTQNLLWRITEGGELNGTSPKVVVLLIGTNNFGISQHRPDEVTRGVQAVVDVINRNHPSTQVLVLGIFPRGKNFSQPERQLIRVVNRSLSDLGGRSATSYLDLSDYMLDETGALRSEFYGDDSLHLSEQGYQLWAQHLRPILENKLGEEVAKAVFRSSKP